MKFASREHSARVGAARGTSRGIRAARAAADY